MNAMDRPGHKRQRTTMQLYRNNRNGTFSDVTKAAGLDVEMYGMGVAVGDYNNDGFPDIFITCVGESHLFRNTGKGTFVDATKSSGLAGKSGLSTSAIWFDYDRDGLLDLLVCNYVRWSAESDVFWSLDGKNKSYCTPEAYRGDTCWLYHNRGNGTFEDVTATSGIFDSSSKSLGVAMLTTTRTAGRISSLPTTRNPTNFIATCAMASSRMLPSKPAWPSAPRAKRALAWAWTWPTSTILAAPASSSPISTMK